MGMPLSSWAMSENETKNLQIHTSGPLRLAILKRDPVPTKLLPARDAWTLLQPTHAVRVCTGDDREEGVIRSGDLALLLPGFGHTLKRHHANTPFGFTALFMEGPFPEPLLSSLQHPPRKWQESSFAVLRSLSLKQLFGIFSQELSNPDGVQLMTRELFLILLGAELSRLTEKEDRGRFPYRLNRSTLQLVLDHMEAHIGAAGLAAVGLERNEVLAHGAGERAHGPYRCTGAGTGRNARRNATAARQACPAASYRAR